MLSRNTNLSDRFFQQSQWTDNMAFDNLLTGKMIHLQPKMNVCMQTHVIKI